MTRLLGILTLLMALLALSAPSVSVGMGMRGPVVTLKASHSTVSERASERVVGCQLLGGKRVLPCHPDLGVMATTVVVVRPAVGHQLPRGMALPLTASVPEAELPPPRRG